MTPLIITYIVTSLINYGGTFAYFQEKYPSIAREHYRDNLGFAILVSLIPFAGFVAGFFATGFYKHGFKFY